VVILSCCLAALIDVGDAVLETCRRSVNANYHLQHLHSCSVLVRELDWMQADLRTGLECCYCFTRSVKQYIW